MTIHRRLGASPHQRGSMTGETCPDILQLDNGDYLIIGRRTGPGIRAGLGEHHASIGRDETAVIVPADVLRAAALQLAAEAVGAGTSKGAP